MILKQQLQLGNTKYMNIKSYFRALLEYEEKEKSLELLKSYFLTKKTNLPKKYRQGKIYLPSFILIKKLRTEYAELVANDTELKQLFDNAIKTSKLFYLNLINLVISSNKNSVDFVKRFEQDIQVIGQKLTNLLVNIKYRIKLNSLCFKKKNSNELKSVFNKIPNLLINIFYFFYNMLYKLTVIHSKYPKFTKKLYYLATTTIIFFVWVINFIIFKNISTIPSAFIDIISSIVIIIVSILISPINNFGEIDISGKNIVAYNYKTFFNNYTNRKMVEVFTLQNPGANEEEE
ncbi:MAG: hypothetical protein HRU35_07665 [Rickettsiaceae bacterium]|nr:hypothetical protein [Rickettsiaceae bacterium]